MKMSTTEIDLESMRLRVNQLTLDLVPYAAKDYGAMNQALERLPEIRSTIVPDLEQLVAITNDDRGRLSFRAALNAAVSEYKSVRERLEHCQERLVHLAMSAGYEATADVGMLTRKIHSDVNRLSPIVEAQSLPEGRNLSKQVSKLAGAQQELSDLQAKITAATAPHT